MKSYNSKMICPISIIINNNNNLYLYSAVSTKKPTALNKATYYKQINITLLI